MMVWLDAITDKLPGPLRLRVRGRSMLPTLRPGDEVVVHPVTAEALVPGDWVVVRSAQGAFLHRYLRTRRGRILTKGDGHRSFDPPWPSDAVVGRVVEAQREGRCFYRRAAGQLRRERLLTAGHYILGDVWGVLRRVKALLLALFTALMAVSLVWAAVTLTGFDGEASTECSEDVEVCITLKWETASETNNLGFRLWRSLTESGGYLDISGFIATLDDAGAFYEHEDADVTPGITYYYKLQDLPADGNQNSYTDAISVIIPSPSTPVATPTLTPTASLNDTPTTTPTPSPTSTPNPNVRFWADKTDLTAGECATLYWQTNNVLAVFFDNLGVSGDGERVFCPCEPESHTLRVRYLNGTTEDFVITLNVTGQCEVTTVAPTPTATLSPRETIFDRATATPRPTSTPGPTLPPADLTATASAEAYIATATASTAEQHATVTASAARLAATQTAVQDVAQASELFTSPLAPPAASSEILVDSGIAPSSMLPTRRPVEDEPSGVPVENLLSVWLLIVGGIIGAGFIGAGILVWKRQQ